MITLGPIPRDPSSPMQVTITSPMFITNALTLTMTITVTILAVTVRIAAASTISGCGYKSVAISLLRKTVPKL